MDSTHDNPDVDLMPPPPLLPAPPSRWRRSVRGFAQVAGGVVVAVLAIGADMAGVPAAPLLVFGGLLLAVTLHVVAHEAGHTLVGLAIGRRLLGIGVGRWRLEATRDGWRPRRAVRVKGVGGFALMWPRAGEPRLATAAFLLGGPLANLAVAAATTARVDLSGASSPAGTLLLLCLGGVGLLMGTANLVPFTVHGWSSDGRGLLALARGDATDATVRTEAVRALVSMSLAGTRPRELPIDTLGPCPDDAEGANMAACFLHAMVALDRDDVAAGRAALTRLLTAYPTMRDGTRQSVALLAASYAARTQRIGLLRAWRPACDGGLLDHRASLAWLDAELALADGDAERARALLNDADTRCARVPDRGAALALADSIQTARARLGTDHAGRPPIGVV